MIVLGISETHCATDWPYSRDGEIIGCASEERFSRLKNDAGIRAGRSTRSLRDLDLSAMASIASCSRERASRPTTG